MQEWTTDWAQTPVAKVYSNKAPGPVFLAFPLYWIWDRIGVDSSLPEKDNIARRHHQGFHFLKWISMLFQVIPFCLLALYFLGHWSELSLNLHTQRLWLIAFLFGSTASVFMNTYFGHGLATVFVLMTLVALSEKKWEWVGFFFGWALLCDYGVSFQLPALTLSLILLGHRSSFYRLTLGALAPAILWTYYHTLCFGSPFHLPNKFQNPIYQDVPESGTSLWGVFDFLPNSNVFVKLLFGPERGILFSQPWVLIALGLAVFYFLKPRAPKPVSPYFSQPLLSFCAISFMGLLWMNSSFGGWHGGASAGPRYLSPALPLLSFFLIPSLESKEGFRRPLSWVLFYSFILFGLILSVGVTTGEGATLLDSLLRELWSSTSNTPVVRFLAYSLLALILWLSFKPKNGFSSQPL